MLVIGLTGGICSGKTTVSQEFSHLGIKVIDADEISRKLLSGSLYSNPSPALLQISKLFGKHLFDNNGQLIRSELKELIFTHTDAEIHKQTLENIIHPLVYLQINQAIQSYKEQASAPAYLIVSIPLLVETAELNSFDRILVVDIDDKTQIKRCFQRDKLSIDSIKKIIAAQIPRNKRLLYADDVLDNNQSINDLHNDIVKLHNVYLQLPQTNILKSKNLKSKSTVPLQ
jgi:dephospho-CoA kinase